MLRGIDISHHNTNLEVIDFCNKYGKPDFIIHKLTEGKTYVDPTVNGRVEWIRLLTDGFVGFYHFARPDNNTPLEEALHFCKNLKDKPPAMLFLDWEGKSLEYNFQWAVDWCLNVHEMTGIDPIIYASASVVKKYAEIYPYWWTAHYNNECVDMCGHDNVVEMFTQYNNKPLDCDVYHGNRVDWRLFIGVSSNEKTIKELLCSWEEDNYLYEVYKTRKE